MEDLTAIYVTRIRRWLSLEMGAYKCITVWGNAPENTAFNRVLGGTVCGERRTSKMEEECTDDGCDITSKLI